LEIGFDILRPFESLKKHLPPRSEDVLLKLTYWVFQNWVSGVSGDSGREHPVGSKKKRLRFGPLFFMHFYTQVGRCFQSKIIVKMPEFAINGLSAINRI